MLERFLDWLRKVTEKMAEANCKAGKHCLHQYNNYKCCCWCRKIFPDD